MNVTAKYEVAVHSNLMVVKGAQLLTLTEQSCYVCVFYSFLSFFLDYKTALQPVLTNYTLAVLDY